MAVINGTPAADNLVGTPGNDTIKGAAGNDTIDAGTGNDFVVGGLGADSIQLGDGDDVFQWNQKDWSENVEGGTGLDRGEIIGVAGAESMGVNVNVNGLYIADFTGIGGPIVTLNDIEHLVLRPLGGADFVQVQDTTGTDLQQVSIDLAATVGGKTADAQTDTVTLMGGLGDNAITVTLAGSKITVDGMPVITTVDHVGKTDVILIDGGSGNDTFDASKIAAGKVVLGLGGGIGEDFIVGSQGNDVVFGGAGNDIILLEGGDDHVIWEDGGGNDAIEGSVGTDTVDVQGGGGTLEMFAIGNRARMRQVDNAMVLDSGGIEQFVFRSGGDGDSVKVGDLSSTSVKDVVIELGVAGAGNGKLDQVALQAGAGSDIITTKVAGATTTVSGLPTKLSILHADGDRLGIDGGDGDDSINVSNVPAKIIGQFDLSGGNGNDTIRGGLLADNLDGGANNDLFLWSHGNGSDNVSGGSGFDTLRVTGAALDESILLGSIAGQTRLVHGPDAASLLLQDVERVQIATLGGADVVFVQNLAGTGIADVAIDLAATVGGKAADTKTDAVAFSGTSGIDNIFLQQVGSTFVVNGLAVTASVDHVGKTDIITLIGGGGHDSVSAGAIAAGKAVVQIIGGEGNDLLTGSKGSDSVIGGSGNDTVNLGDGNDIFVCATGDGTDEVHGEGGTDTFKFGGISGLGPITIAPDGSGVDFIRSVEGAKANLDGIERIELGAAAGFDSVEIQNLAGTGVKLVAIDFANSGGAKGDSLPDSATIIGSDGNETVTVALSAGLVSVKGLASQLTIAHAEAIDSLAVAGGGGNDSISAASLGSVLSQVYLLGGTGNDKLTGHVGYNAIAGGDGNDTLAGGAGNDSLEGGVGNDRIDGGAGNDGILGEAGNDYLIGGTGNDVLVGGAGNDTITGGTGSDTVYYTNVLDGHDVIMAFDGNAAGGQDILDLDQLFANLSVPVGDRAARVSIIDTGATVEIAVDTNGDLNFDLAVATLKTADAITVGQDIFVGL